MLTAFRWVTLIIAGLSGLGALSDDDRHSNAVDFIVSGALFLLSFVPAIVG